ncbi:UNVERIFIED_CONTAM: hypothetical protein Slati_4006500 [Sesamum latifolium]|uniref:Ribbon-helix-helix protein CopG domain-containing protein n=1 Tax=Sesamum latifolium TaxID=2727402 RepID=A0AAW2TPU6_9LAMI
MGNCIRKESPTQWGGEDWSLSGTDNNSGTRRNLIRDEDSVDYTGQRSNDPAGEKKARVLSASSRVETVVKIKISKQQLEQLLRNADARGLSAEQVLAELMNAGDGYQRPWRPALQSIPE